MGQFETAAFFSGENMTASKMVVKSGRWDGLVGRAKTAGFFFCM